MKLHTNWISPSRDSIWHTDKQHSIATEFPLNSQSMWKVDALVTTLGAPAVDCLLERLCSFAAIEVASKFVEN